MSRIGKMPVEVPKDVKINIDSVSIKVEGPKGKLEQSLVPEVSVVLDDKIVTVNRKNESKRARAMHGLYRNLVNNMVTGVSKGFQKTLKLVGVGYRAEVKGKSLILNLGYSNPVDFPIPAGIDVKVDANTTVIISSIDRQQLGQVCANIRGFRPPEPYKGKGIRYDNEVVRKKVGKTGAK